MNLQKLHSSLAKKEALLESKFSQHFADVKSANGQPLNDKRNGQATVNRWNKQSDSIRNLQESIEKTKRAIEKEEAKIANVAEAAGTLPQFLLNAIKDGTLNQWRRHPNYFFVPGVEKARFKWTGKTLLMHYRSEIPNEEQKTLFYKVARKLAKHL